MPATLETTPMLPGLSPVCGKRIVARFDTEHLCSDGGLLALREIENRLGMAQRHAGAPAGAGHLLEAALARSDQRHFRQREKAVAQGQHEDERDFGQHRGNDRGDMRHSVRVRGLQWCGAARPSCNMPVIPYPSGMASMFSLQTIFGKGDKFYGLLEQSAATVCESAKALHELLSKPGQGSVMAAFTATRAREKELAAQISEGLDRKSVV